MRRKFMPALAALLIGGLATSTSQAAWTPPVTISSSGDSPRAAIDAQGYAVFGWRDPSIRARTRSADGTLSGVKTVSLAAGFTPQLDADSQGNALIVWRAKVGGRQVIRARELTAGGALKPTQTISPVGQNAFAPQVAVNATGKAVVTWQGRYDGSKLRVQGRTRSSSGSLGPVKALSATGQHYYHSPQAEINGKGRAVFVWERGSTNGCCERIETRTLYSNGNLSAVQALATPERFVFVSKPDVAIDASGNAFYIWETSDNRCCGHPPAWADTRVRFSSGTLGPGRTLGGSIGGGVLQPRVAVTSEGTATFTWTPESFAFGSLAYVGTRFSGGSFGPAQRLSSLENPEDRPPDLGVDRNGNAVISWARSGFDCDADPDCPPVEDLAAVVRSPDGTFGSPHTLSPTGTSPDVAVNADGDAVVAWQDSGRRVRAAAGP
jgi:hypothetical protein